ncbi:MAG: Eco47II family restriction endonuclease [Eubacteriales bacterium]
MTDWSLKFLGEEDFTRHVELTIEKYGEKLEPFDIKKFNKNLIDPVKLIFDKIVYGANWDEMIKNEIFRQRDKSNNNDIGYFHQTIFRYIDKCRVPENGKDGGWDVIYENKEGIQLVGDDIVHKIYVEMKNKHNTMNSASTGKTYIKMQNQLLNDDDCACFLVEAIAQKSQNIIWNPTVDGKKISHKRIRRVSLDQFFALVTGEQDAFYQICMMLPEVIENVISKSQEVKTPHDTVNTELRHIAKLSRETEDVSMAIAIYMLGFSTYHGFCDLVSNVEVDNAKILKRIYEYAKGINP